MESPLVAHVANQKLRGGYYTPPGIAHFLCAWAIRSPGDRVLEPSCGDGAVLQAAAERLLALGASGDAVSHQVQGVELYASEADRDAT